MLCKELKMEALAQAIAERERELILREERIDEKLQAL
jgi:hypothetical protein